MPLRFSLRTRLALGTSLVIAALVGAFALATLLALSLHVAGLSHQEARAAALDLRGDVFARGSPVPNPFVLQEFRSAQDPQVWLTVGRDVIFRSPNAPPAVPPVTGPLNAIVSLQAYRVTLPAGHGYTLILDWPLAADLDLLRDLALVLVVGAAATVLAGILVARWATRRVLEPVHRMTQAARRALARGAPFALPTGLGESDEFTELGEVLEQLTQTLTRAREADRRLLADAAHELRTPLAILDGNLRLIHDWGGEDPDVRAESLRVMQRTVSRLTRLVQDLLVLVRAETQVDAAENADSPAADLTSLAQELCEDATALATGLTVTLHAPAHPLPVAGDPHAIREAAWAVVENALQYTPAGGSVEVTVARASDGSSAWLTVDDSGPGIPPEERERVFDRFFRGSAGRRRPEGTGLGLAVARALVEAQGGRLTVDASPLGGARLRMRFRLLPKASRELPGAMG